MKKSIALYLAVIAVGCDRPPPPRGDVVRPVKTMVVAAGGEPRVRVFPGKAEAAKRVELAFQVPGIITQLPVKEGDKVTKGQVIAQLRQDEFKARLATLQGQLDQARAALRALQAGERAEQRLRLESNVRAAEAKMANARAELTRNQQLIRTNAVSRTELELSETNFRVAQEEHKAAIQLLEKGTVAREEDIEGAEAAVRGLEGRVVEANLQLSDSTLKAPYDGVIAKRFVEQNQNVQAKQPIVKFQDVDEIDISVDVPESVMIADIRTADILKLVAEFTGAPGVEFPAHIKEVAQAADPTTQTFRVRVGMKAPADLTILPGMSGAVSATYRRAGILGNRILVPIAAVFKDPTGAQVAWVLNKDQTVSRRTVKIGEAAGGQVEILDGLQTGDRIAVAGVRFLREGMNVRDLGNALGAGQ